MSEEADQETQPEPVAKALPPFQLKRGTTIRIGYRQGRVENVRGRGAKPYDFMVRWDAEKYPQWLLYATAERDYQSGHLTVVR
jgi:hypothetical protein